MDFERIFDDSYERVLKIRHQEKGFFETFYERFMKADQRVADHFANTDMEKQQRMLEKSFYRLVVFYATNYADDYLEQIAVKHSQAGLGIAPELYDIWLDVLIETVADFDPQFDDNIELAWRLVLSTGITYMKFKYDK